jgi:hypothetical protein
VSPEAIRRQSAVNRIAHHDSGSNSSSCYGRQAYHGTAMDFGISGGIKDVLANSLPRNTEKAHGQMWVSAGDVQ